MRNKISLLLVIVLVASVYAKEHGQQSKGRLEHELTNRPAHVDRNRHREHGSGHRASMVEHKRNKNQQTHKQIHQQEQEDELLAGERLMHVNPRLPSISQRSNRTAGGVVDKTKKRKGTALSKKAQKFAQVVAKAKAISAAQSRLLNKPSKFAGDPMTKEHKKSPMSKSYKGRRVAKKYNASKHAWKKALHRDKLLRTKHFAKDFKEGKKEKLLNKELFKGKEPKAHKKERREKKEKKAKLMLHKKRV